jgi:1,4-alpha-glucan branching enzyme
MITLADVGAVATQPTTSGVQMKVGIYLPGLDPSSGFEVWVRVIHQQDRFDPTIQPLDAPLTPVAATEFNLWRADLTIPPMAGTHFGQPGTYLYRYQLRQTLAGMATSQVIVPWFTDPFARATDVGELSAVTTSDPSLTLAWTDDRWKVPDLDDLVVYELQVEEFNGTFDGVRERLPYLKSLGVTCLELMPVTSLKLDFDWGYGPLHYFAPCARWGGPLGLKRLVDACHSAGVAVILDVVYQHVDPSFPYHLVYEAAGVASPMIGSTGPFGPQIDFSKAFAQDYVQAANAYWLHEYHVDGFRYDEVTDLYDGPTGVGYAKMAYDAYNASLAIPRFTPSAGTAPGEYSRIIQCPEALNRPQEILQATYSCSTWQDGLLNKAEDMARHGYVDDSFLQLLDVNAQGYPVTKTVHDRAGAPVEMPVAPFQYLESHDHSQLISFVGSQPDFSWEPVIRALSVPFGQRDLYYKLQPFVIALYTAQGTPMLFQGQEFADNYVLPDAGTGRIRLERNVHWEYFYDECGRPLIRLYRNLGALRLATPALRSREPGSFVYYAAESRPPDGVVAYRRQSTSTGQNALVFLNFSNDQQEIAVPFPAAGTYREMIDADIRPTPYDIAITAPGQSVTVAVPANYGYIIVSQGGQQVTARHLTSDNLLNVG